MLKSSNITVVVTPEKIEAKHRYTISFTKIILLLILLVIVWFDDDLPIFFENYCSNCAANISLFTIFFLMILVLTSFPVKRKLIVFPLNNTALKEVQFSKTEEITWPEDFSLQYEIKYDSFHKMIDVSLFAASAEMNRIIPVYSFKDRDSFKTFQKIYNQNFPEHQIK